MKSVLKFLAIVVAGTALLLGGMFAYVEYLQTAGSTTTSPSSPVGAATPSPELVASYGSYVFHYRVIDGTAAAIFTPVLPRDDATVVGAIKALVRAAYDADIDRATTALVGREIVLTAPAGTFYAMLVKEDTGQVHSIRVRR